MAWTDQRENWQIIVAESEVLWMNGWITTESVLELPSQNDFYPAQNDMLLIWAARLWEIWARLWALVAIDKPIPRWDFIQVRKCVLNIEYNYCTYVRMQGRALLDNGAITFAPTLIPSHLPITHVLRVPCSSSDCLLSELRLTPPYWPHLLTDNEAHLPLTLPCPLLGRGESSLNYVSFCDNFFFVVYSPHSRVQSPEPLKPFKTGISKPKPVAVRNFIGCPLYPWISAAVLMSLPTYYLRTGMYYIHVGTCRL